jgi:hypothetical protein
VAGTLEDMLIWNLTTNEKCLIKGLRASDLPVGAYLEIDSETGKVCIVNGAERELAMYYHDDGLITLAPCTPLTRDLRITSASGNTIYSDGLFLPHMVGQYFWISGTGYKIQRVDNASTATLYSTLTQATPFIVSIGTINDILIYGNENLTKLEIDYMPKIR